MADARRGGAHLAGLQPRPGLHLVGGVDQLRRLGAGGHRGLPLPGRRGRHRDPAPADRAHARHLARGGARHPAGPALRLPGRGAVGARAGVAVQHPEAAARSLRAGRQRPAGAGPGDLRLHRRRSGVAGLPRLRRQGAAQRGRRRPVRLGRRPPRSSPVARHRHLRAPRQGHDPAARPGAGGAPRDVRRPRDPCGHRLPVRPRRDRGRAAAGAPVRHRAGGRRARADQLLGLQLDRLLRPPRGVLLQRGPRRAGHRVQGDGEGLPRGRPRGNPRCGLQPHGRGRGHGADAELPGAGRQDLPPGAAAAGRRGHPRTALARHLLGRDRAAATPSTPAIPSRCG